MKTFLNDAFYLRILPGVVFCLLIVAPFRAGGQEDSIIVAPLDSSVIKISINTSGLQERSRGVSFDVSRSLQLPRILGSSDPLRYIQYLPWVQTTSEVDAGIRINGCESSQTFINIDGIPVYGCQHLFGLFSVFTPSHFDKMSILTLSRTESRIGGELTMNSKTAVPSRPGGEINVGLMEAEGSFFTNIGKRTSLYASARRSYLNLLYGKFLQLDGVPFVYNLTDANLTVCSKVSDRDEISARFYWGQDNVKCKISDYLLDANDRWGNLLGGINWTHRFSGSVLRQQVYYTNYSNRTDIDYSLSSISPSSSITDIAYTASLDFDSKLSAGGKFVYYRTIPQSHIQVENPAQNAFEGDLWVSKVHDFFHWFQFSASAKMEYFRGDDKQNHFGFSPDLSFTFFLPQAGKIILSTAIRHQYIFQTGISNINMPLEFWLTAGKYSDPQRSIDADLQYKLDLSDSKYSLSVGAYYKYLTNQLEYDGQVLDLVRDTDRFEDHLLHGYGHNYGVSVMFHKNTGRLDGWVSYCYSRSIRDFKERNLSHWCPSSHDRPHEFKMLAVYHLPRWDFSGTFICASGTPFTPVNSYYVNAGRIMCEYAEYNSARLPAYLRLDLSANFYFKKDHHNGLNLSLYNVTCRSNPSTYRLFFNKENNSFAYLPMSMRLFCLPSLSYFHKF